MIRVGHYEVESAAGRRYASGSVPQRRIARLSDSGAPAISGWGVVIALLVSLLGWKFTLIYVVVGMADVRGLVGTPSLLVDGVPRTLAAGTGAMASRMEGVHALLDAPGGALPASNVHLEMALAGTQTLGIARRGNAPLPLAVVAIAPGLEDAGRADFDQCFGQIIGGIDRLERRDRAARIGAGRFRAQAEHR